MCSDIHGSFRYALKALKAFEKSGAESLICLGDFYYHGPRNKLPYGYAPMDEAKLLNQYKDKIIAIRGNCDAEVDEFISEFKFVSQHIVENKDGKKLLFAHGHHPIENPSQYDVIVTGHTHIALLEKKDGIVYVNPGSVSLPKADNSRNYLLIDDEKIEMIDLESGKTISELYY